MVTKVKKSVALIITTFLLVVLTASFTKAAVLPEARGMWVIRDQLTSPEKITTFVEVAATNNFNFLVVQVVGRGDAYYISDLLPRSEALANQPADFDPLKLTIELAHAKGIKVIAWLNDLYLASFKANPLSKDHIIHAHPEWITYNMEGVSMLEMDKNTTGPEIEGLFLEPGLKEVQNHIAARYKEIATKYAVDGVHHDYVRYSNPNLGYHPEIRRIFTERYGVDPLDLRAKPQEVKKTVGVEKYLELKAAWDQFRRDNVTEVVKTVYNTVKAINPLVEVSSAVVGYYKDAYSMKFQDWKLWLELGYLDVAMPMIYEPQTLVVNYMVDQALSMEGKGSIIPGFGAYTQLKDLPGLIEKVQYAREKGAKGILFFDYGSMYSTNGYLAGLKKALFLEPAPYPQLSK